MIVFFWTDQHEKKIVIIENKLELFHTNQVYNMIQWFKCTRFEFPFHTHAMQCCAVYIEKFWFLSLSCSLCVPRIHGDVGNWVLSARAPYSFASLFAIFLWIMDQRVEIEIRTNEKAYMNSPTALKTYTRNNNNFQHTPYVVELKQIAHFPPLAAQRERGKGGQALIVACHLAFVNSAFFYIPDGTMRCTNYMWVCVCVSYLEAIQHSMCSRK